MTPLMCKKEILQDTMVLAFLNAPGINVAVMIKHIFDTDAKV